MQYPGYGDNYLQQMQNKKKIPQGNNYQSFKGYNNNTIVPRRNSTAWKKT